MKITKKIILCLLACVVVVSAVVIPISATSVSSTPTKYGVYNPFTYLSLEDTSNYQQYWLFNDPRRVNSYVSGDNVLTQDTMTLTNADNIQETFRADTYLNVTTYYQHWGLRPKFWYYLETERQTFIDRISIHYEQYYCHDNTYETLIFGEGNAEGTTAYLSMSFDVDVTNQTTGEITTFHFDKSKTVSFAANSITLGELDNEAVSNYLKNDYGVDLIAGHWLVRNYTTSIRLADGYFRNLSTVSENGEYYELNRLKELRTAWQYAVDASDRFNFEWLIDAVEAFFAFELLPGLPLSYVFYGICGISMLIAILKIYLGG